MTSRRYLWMIFFGLTVCFIAMGKDRYHDVVGEECGTNYFTQQLYKSIPGAEAEADVSQLATGVYLVRIVGDGQQIARRVSVM